MKSIYEYIPTSELLRLTTAINMTELIEDDKIREAMQESLNDIAIASGRAGKRREQNKAADQTRLLAGARLPRGEVERYREAAERTNRSLYRFVADALRSEYRRVMSNALNTVDR